MTKAEGGLIRNVNSYRRGKSSIIATPLGHERIQEKGRKICALFEVDS